MPTGHFRIGDLSFSFEGSIQELASVQSVMREFRQAEHRLKKAAGAEKVYLICDKNLEGESGTFDKLRLRAYDDKRNYTMDIGETSENPLGVYPGLKDDKNIHVFHRETEATWEIKPDGTAVGKNDTGNGRNAKGTDTSAPKENTGRTKSGGGGSPQQPRRDASGSQRSGASGRDREAAPLEGQGSQDPNERARTILKKAEVHPDNKPVGETDITSGPLVEEVQWYANACNRGPEYMTRVLKCFGAEAIEALTIGDLRGAFRLIHSEEKLRRIEEGAKKQTT